MLSEYMTHVCSRRSTVGENKCLWLLAWPELLLVPNMCVWQAGTEQWLIHRLSLAGLPATEKILPPRKFLFSNSLFTSRKTFHKRRWLLSPRLAGFTIIYSIESIFLF